MSLTVRNPAAAGSFYPDNPARLQAELNELFRLAGKPAALPGAVVGVLAPHAGYVYSGKTAAAAFAPLKGLQFDTAVIFGAGHTAIIETAAIIKEGAFATPLGPVPIDEELAGALLDAHPGLFTHNPTAHAREHSLEVQLPFLIRILPGIKILPVALNQADAATAALIGEAAARAAGKKRLLIVVSTDLSHYPAARLAEKSDASMLKTIESAARSNAPERVALAEELLVNENLPGLDTACCGVAAVMAGLAASCALGANDFTVTAATNSASSEMGDAERVVGYGAGAFIKRAQPPEPLELSPEERKQLLALARSSIKQHLSDKTTPHQGLADNPLFNIPAALFVTLTIDGELRGCIGSLEPSATMRNAVSELAVSAAFSDPRFPPLSAAELARVKIEISVLSPLRKVASPDEIVPGKHGVLIRQGRRGGTYLPQVWEHFNENKELFLSSLCAEKAGLPPDSWKTGADLYVYTATAFYEK